MQASDAGEVVADLLRNLARLVLHGLALALALLLLATRALRVALAVGRFLARDPGQVARAQDRLGTLSPHQTPSSNAPEKRPATRSSTRAPASGSRGSSSRSPMPGPPRV